MIYIVNTDYAFLLLCETNGMNNQWKYMVCLQQQFLKKYYSILVVKKRNQTAFVLLQILNNKTYCTIGNVIANPHSRAKNELTNCAAGTVGRAIMLTATKKGQSWTPQVLWKEGEHDCRQFATEKEAIALSSEKNIYKQPNKLPTASVYIQGAVRESKIETIS